MKHYKQRIAGGFEKISGRPVRASSINIGLDDLIFVVEKIYNVGQYKINIKTYEGYWFSLPELTEWSQDICNENGWQCNVMTSSSGDMNMVFKQNDTTVLTVTFRIGLQYPAVEYITNVVSYRI